MGRESEHPLTVHYCNHLC